MIKIAVALEIDDNVPFRRIPAVVQAMVADYLLNHSLSGRRAVSGTGEDGAEIVHGIIECAKEPTKFIAAPPANIEVKSS